MNIKKFFLSLSLSLLAISPLSAEVVTDDGTHVYTTRTWGEFSIENQRLLLCYFEDVLTDRLKQTGIPTFWNKRSKTALIGTQSRFDNIVNHTHVEATNFATKQNITLEDLLPTGFIIGLGVTGSGDFIAGLGGSALLTLVVAPTEIETLDKMTGITTTTYQASWAIGGIGQAAVGAGTGGGIAVRGAVGLIWGSLPDANLLQGTALGAGGSISAIAGLGFKVAALFGTTSDSKTKINNLIALATYDIGITANASVDAEIFYFMDCDEIVKFISKNSIQQLSGTTTIPATSLITN